MCVGREGKLHTRALAHLASPSRAGRGMAWQNTQAHDVRVNGPPKSGPSPCRGAASFRYFCFGYLAFKSARYGILIGFLIFQNWSRREVVGLFYITDLSSSTKTHLIELGFCLSLLLRRLRSCSIPNAGVHRRTGEQVSGNARSCDPAPGEGE